MKVTKPQVGKVKNKRGKMADVYALKKLRQASDKLDQELGIKKKRWN